MSPNGDENEPKVSPNGDEVSPNGDEVSPNGDKNGQIVSKRRRKWPFFFRFGKNYHFYTIFEMAETRINTGFVGISYHFTIFKHQNFSGKSIYLYKSLEK